MGWYKCRHGSNNPSASAGRCAHYIGQSEHILPCPLRTGQDVSPGHAEGNRPTNYTLLT